MGVLSEEQQAFVETARRFAKEKARARTISAASRRAASIARSLARWARSASSRPNFPRRSAASGRPRLTSGLDRRGDRLRRRQRRLSPDPGFAQRQDHRHARLARLAEEWIPKLSRARRSSRSASPSRAAVPTPPISRSPPGATESAYILKGEKSSISLADQADATIVFARTGAAAEGARASARFWWR